MRRALLIPLALCFAACQGVSAERLAAAPPELYWVEYYKISDR